MSFAMRSSIVHCLETNTIMMVNQNEIKFSKFLFVLFSEGDLLEQSVGSGTFVVAVERTW